MLPKSEASWAGPRSEIQFLPDYDWVKGRHVTRSRPMRQRKNSELATLRGGAGGNKQKKQNTNGEAKTSNYGK